ncbi:unnamed protein product, partial [Tilletia laevis]
MTATNRSFFLLIVAFLAAANMTFALPASGRSTDPSRRLVGAVVGGVNTAACKLTNSCKPVTTASTTKPTYAAKVIAAGNSVRPTPTIVWTIPFFPALMPAKTTTYTSIKTATVTVTSTKTTVASVTSTATATKTVSGVTTVLTSVTVVPVTTVVPVITVVTTTTNVPVTTTVVPTTSAGTPTTSFITTAVAATPTSIATGDPTTPEQQAVVDTHNAYRAKHNAPALTWNNTLAAFAKNHASKCIWAHSAGPYGENGAATVGTPVTMAAAADMWYNEIKAYNFSAPNFSEETGHFSQLVWKSSRTVGCAVVQCTP